MGLGFLWKALTVIVAVIAPLPQVTAHGYLEEPVSRNLLAHRRGLEYDHMSLAGGGPHAVWPDGNWQFGGGGNHFTCGRQQYDTPGEIQRMWITGQQVKIKVVFTVVHRGHNYFGLCPADQEPTPECFAKNWLTNIETDQRYWDLGGQSKGTYEMLFQLPADYECPNCVLWWWWVTGNSCLPPGDRGNLPACGEYAIPEEFWNCADVSIMNRTMPMVSPPPPTESPPPPTESPPPPTESPPPPRKSPPPPRKSPPPPRKSPPPPRKSPPPSPLAKTCTDHTLPFGDDQSPFYFVCESGRQTPTKMSCPPGTLWNTDISGCDWPKRRASFRHAVKDFALYAQEE